MPRVALFERFGGPEVGAPVRRRFLEVQGHLDQASLDAWRRLAIPLYTRVARDPDMAWRAVNRSEVLQWFTRPGGESHTFDMLGDLTASDVRPWYSVARTIPFTQSRARRISRRRCRSIWCGSNGLRIAGTRW
jgi:hypothetical protein